MKTINKIMLGVMCLFAMGAELECGAGYNEVTARMNEVGMDVRYSIIKTCNPNFNDGCQLSRETQTDVRVGMRHRNEDTGFCEYGSILMSRSTDFDSDEFHEILTNDFEVEFLQDISVCDIPDPADSDYIDNY